MPAEATIVVTYIDAVPEDAWTGLAMVSLPIIPDDIDPKNVVGFYGSEWSTFVTDSHCYATYPDELTWFLPTQLTPGKGYWAYFHPSGAVPYGTVPPQDQPANVHLKRGWNLVGQPFISPVVWNVSAMIWCKPGFLSSSSLAIPRRQSNFMQPWVAIGRSIIEPGKPPLSTALAACIGLRGTTMRH